MSMLMACGHIPVLATGYIWDETNIATEFTDTFRDYIWDSSNVSTEFLDSVVPVTELALYTWDSSNVSTEFTQ